MCRKPRFRAQENLYTECLLLGVAREWLEVQLDLAFGWFWLQHLFDIELRNGVDFNDTTFLRCRHTVDFKFFGQHSISCERKYTTAENGERRSHLVADAKFELPNNFTHRNTEIWMAVALVQFFSFRAAERLVQFSYIWHKFYVLSFPHADCYLGLLTKAP